MANERPGGAHRVNPDLVPTRAVVRFGPAHHTLALWIVGVLAASVLVLTADYQIYDNNFYSLAETPGLLAGDHPYRDFFDWGVPLQAALSATMQWLVGYRLIGEFVLQWTWMVAGLVMAFQIGLRLSRSLVASFICMLPAILNFAGTPTVHNSKLFIYPAAILIIWRYMEQPTARRAAAMGAFAAVAFFFRHDHGVYVGAGVLFGMMLARLARPEARRPRTIVRDVAACALATSVLIAPWAIVVARSEGLIDYVDARAFINDTWRVGRPVFLSVLDMNPRLLFAPADPTAPGLSGWVPARGAAEDWLYQSSVLVVLVILVIALVDLARAVHQQKPVGIETCRLLLAGVVVALVEYRLFRESGYFVLVAPLIAAFGARLLVSSTLVPVTRSVTLVLLVISTIAVGGFVRDSKVLQAGYLLERLPRTFARLLASPPIDGLASARDALRIDRAGWLELGYGDRSTLMIRYMYECAAPGDRILVSGHTPYQISYYVERPLAGGHLYWRDLWRSDARRELQSLDLLRRQSVPFAFSTHEPVLDYLSAYPHIRAYMQGHYVEIEGSSGHLLVDRRRAPVRAFGALEFPCFR